LDRVQHFNGIARASSVSLKLIFADMKFWRILECIMKINEAIKIPNVVRILK